MPQNVKKSNKKSLPRIKDDKTTNSDSETKENAVELVGSGTVEKFSLYVRGAAWIKDRDNVVNRLKVIEPRIQDVRHPRQKSADYCFIDFASATDRDESYEKLKDHSEITVKLVTKDVPKLLEKRKKKMTEKREAKKETRKLLAQIKKKEKLNASQAEKTNQIVIVNVPRQVTVTELKQQYSNAVKVNVKAKNKAKSLHTAIITFANPSDAFSASKESIVLHGQKINVMLNTDASFKQLTKHKGKAKGKRKASLEPDNAEPQLKSAKVKAN